MNDEGRKLAYISQPMKGLTKDQIAEKRETLTALLADKGYDIIDTVFDDFDEKNEFSSPERKGLYFLGRALSMMSTADIVVFCDGWEQQRGCSIEHDCAVKYGIPCFEEHQLKDL